MKRVVALCKICAEVKPLFFRQEPGVFIKSTQPLERLSIDFKGPLPFPCVCMYVCMFFYFSAATAQIKAQKHNKS